MSSRQPIASIALFLLCPLFSVLTRDVAGAQERWPPWQSYGEAENTRAQKAARRRPATADVAALNKQIAQLKAAGKYAEAVPLAKQALVLAEKKGANSPDVAQALDTLAGLYEAQNKFAEAEPLLKRSLSIRERHRWKAGRCGLARTPRRRLRQDGPRLGRAGGTWPHRHRHSRQEKRRWRSSQEWCRAGRCQA